MHPSKTWTIALALAGCCSGPAVAGLVGYRFSGVVDRVINTAGTTFEDTSIGDSVDLEFMFDPTLFPALFDLQAGFFAWDYVISSFSIDVGGVSPIGPPLQVAGLTNWGMSDDARDGNDAVTAFGSFATGEFVFADVAFTSSDVFTPAVDPALMMPPLNLADAAILYGSGSLGLGAGGTIGFDITSVTFVPGPGVGAVGLVGLLAALTRGRRSRQTDANRYTV